LRLASNCEDVGVAQDVGGLGDELALLGEFKDGLFVFSGGEAEKER